MARPHDASDGNWPGKSDLPYPYNRDLSWVLQRLNRVTPEGRIGLANDRTTASLLAAGLRLLDQHLGPEAESSVTSERRLLGPLSTRRVSEAFHDNPDPFVRNGNGEGLLKDRWGPHVNYILDLIRFATSTWVYHPEARAQRSENIKRLVNGLSGMDFVHALQSIAYQHTRSAAHSPSVRLGLALLLVADGDEEVAEIVKELYEDYLRFWGDIYGGVLKARGLRLRPGLTLDRLADTLSAASDGVALRAIGNPASGVLDETHQHSLLGDLALAVVYGFLEPEEAADGLSLQEAVAARFGRREDQGSNGDEPST